MAEIRMTRDFFLWCMSVVYLFAFASLFVQIPGLYGDNGILPARLVLQKEAESLQDLVRTQPTLLRLLPHLGLDVQASMDLLCLGGVILSFVAMITKAQRNTIVFILLWAFYFSLFQVGQTFLWFQWDILLLEAGILSILVAPFTLLGMLPVRYHQHDHITLWLVKWLLFRLMFASGVVKLTSYCPTWWGLTALTYHYETQCIPTPLAWYIHQFPEWIHKLSVVLTYVIEIPVPLLFFSPVRTHRLLASYAQVFLMVLIILTGNYNFFNLLTCALCVAVLDDHALWHCMGKVKAEETKNEYSCLPIVRRYRRPMKWALDFIAYGGILYWTVRLFNVHIVRKPLSIQCKTDFTSEQLQQWLQVVLPLTIWVGVVSLGWEIITAIFRSVVRERGMVHKLINVGGCVLLSVAAVFMFSISLVPLTRVDRMVQGQLPDSIKTWHNMAQPYRLSSPYGLFRRMTGVGGRPEVIIEGSNLLDRGWKEYHFNYKPGNVSDPLPIVAPHQPRLDWQMWFAALGSYEHNPWFLNLVYRLLNNQKEVLRLIKENPFPEKPPKYMKATLYHYHFTKWDKSTSHSDDAIWTRKKVREYLPVITKDEPSFVNYINHAGLDKIAKPPGKKKKPTILKYILSVIRGYAGQMDGWRTCIGLFMAGLVLSFFDPAIKFIREPYS